jgi:hypothetical protein
LSAVATITDADSATDNTVRSGQTGVSTSSSANGGLATLTTGCGIARVDAIAAVGASRNRAGRNSSEAGNAAEACGTGLVSCASAATTTSDNRGCTSDAECGSAATTATTV